MAKKSKMRGVGTEDRRDVCLAALGPLTSIFSIREDDILHSREREVANEK